MPINVVNIVSDINRINLGVWKAALVGSDLLTNDGFKSFLFVCSEDPLQRDGINSNVTLFFLGSRKHNQFNLKKKLQEEGLTPKNTIIVTHGSWLMPTRLGKLLSDSGYPWVYVPQGMLEPWSMSQGRLKKRLYFSFFEGVYIKKASAIRAVSKPEKVNLEVLLKRKVQLIENGVYVPTYTPKAIDSIRYLFMARLHAKKGILPLVRAWNSTMLNNNARLIIAGTDEGELKKINQFVKGNVEYVGPVYGEAKINLLQNSHYFCLPSFSEGFPTSALEAMSYGMIPLVSMGCNFPEIFENNLGFQIEPNDDSIAFQLSLLKDKNFDLELSEKNHAFIKAYYSESIIGEKLVSLYVKLLNDLHKS